jgi:hypothetical protein
MEATAEVIEAIRHFLIQREIRRIEARHATIGAD